MLDSAIADCGTILGFDPSDFADRNHVAVAIEGIGELHLERQDEALLIYLSRAIEVGIDRLSLYRSALRAVHFENGLPARVQCALYHDNLIFLARYEPDEVDLPVLEQSFDLLIELHQRVP